jgi:hypothetical protein
VPKREIGKGEERYPVAADETVDAGRDRFLLLGRDPQRAGDQDVDAAEAPVREVVCQLRRLRPVGDDMALEREHALELGYEGVGIQDRRT